MNMILESRNPRVGIFWVVDGDIIDFSQDVRELSNNLGYIDSPRDHHSAWRDMLKLYPHFKDYEYYEVPRGRVTYNTRDGVYHIISSREILQNDSLVRKIMRTFSLPVSSTKLIADAHYEMTPSEEMWDD